jgi:hypothetical protein
MMSHLVIKNTFLDIEEAEEVSPDMRSRRRCKTEPAALVSTPPLESDDEEEDDVPVAGEIVKLPSLLVSRPFTSLGTEKEAPPSALPSSAEENDRQSQDLPDLVVKNGFLNFTGTEALTPVRRPCRSKTDAAILSSSTSPAGSDDESEGSTPNRRTAAFAQAFVVDVANTPQDFEDYADFLTAQIEAGGDALAAAVATIRPFMLSLSFDRVGCRVVQLALERAKTRDAVELAAGFCGHVREAVLSPHANHVIQKMIDVLPACHTQFVLEEVIGAAAELAKHRFGSRVLTRLVHRHSCELARALTNELVHDVSDLSRHTFAHYVMEAVLDNAQDKELHFIAML